MRLLIAILIILCSGVVNFYLDVCKGIKSPVFYWVVGVVTGSAAAMII